MPGSADSVSNTTDRLRQFRRERDWDRFHTPRNLAVALVVEVGELLEHLLWRDDDEVRDWAARHPHGVGSELADVAIHVMQLADVLGIDLPAAIEAKLELNAARYRDTNGPTRPR